MTGKTLPSVYHHDKKAAFIDMVSDNICDITNALQASEYETKTYGKTISPAARPCGEVLRITLQ
jgi:hypothetical protein